MTSRYAVDRNREVIFNNQVDFCVGSGRLGLALHDEYLKQLAYVQERIGFKYLRAHGIFSDDIGICHVHTDPDGERRLEFNFTYIDRILDSLLDLEIRPFIELGFMPQALASGEQTVFYWKGNVTPPQDYAEWNQLLEAFFRHLLHRYGEQVYDWPIEVWNEPNLTVFWKDADMKEYFRLFKHSFKTIKALSPRFQVGGPAICGVDDERWMRAFLDFCRDEQLAIDFVTRHHYVSELPEPDGHYSYVKLHPLEQSLEPIAQSRAIMAEYPEFRDLTMHITEFNTSYVPNAPIHDTPYHAAYLAHLLAKFGQYNTTYSYWTFGDVFEEYGIPFTPFHGGFGLVANGLIPKPAFWTFEFFKRLEGKPLLNEDDCVLVEAEAKLSGLVWNLDAEPKTVTIDLQSEQGGTLVTRLIDETHGNPLKLWHDLGEPASPAKAELELLRLVAQPFVESCRLDNGESLTFELEPNAILYFELTHPDRLSDRGYDYERVMAQR